MKSSKCSPYLIIVLVSVLMSSQGWCGKIVYPWRATTALVKSGETFEIWFEADAGQTVTDVELEGPYNTVQTTHTVATGNWEYDATSGNTYNTRITVTVPANAPADRYDLILKTNQFDEVSLMAVRVIKDYRDNYTMFHFSDVHLGSGTTSVILYRVSKLVQTANIMGCEFLWATGDNIYWSNSDFDNRQDRYLNGQPSLGMVGMRDFYSTVNITCGNHGFKEGTNGAYKNYPQNAQFWNDYWGVQSFNFTYGDNRFMGVNNGWDNFNPSDQYSAHRSWLDAVGDGNLRIVAGHKYASGGNVGTFHNMVDFNLFLVGHNHHLAAENPKVINGAPVQYIANATLSYCNFNLYKVDSVNGTYTVENNYTAVQNPNDAATSWIDKLTLDFSNSNDGSSATNTATFVNDFAFDIPDARARFIMPKGTMYGVTKGYVEQQFEGDLYHIVDVRVPLDANSTETVDIVDAGSNPNFSQFISQSVPSQLDQGETTTVTVTMKNVGSDTWTNAAGHKLASQNPNNNSTWGINRVSLPHNVAPDQNVTFSFQITAPVTPGLYNFQWMMIDESNPNSGLFGASSANIEIRVGSEPVRVEAEDFDVNVGFQTQNTTDIGGGQNIGFATTDDYMEYNLNISEAGTYGFTFRVASPTNGANFDLKLGNTVLYSIVEAPTGGNQTWETTSVKEVDLPAGNITLTILAKAGGWNINWFEYVQMSSNMPPVIGTTPSMVAEVGVPYGYDLNASDADGDPLTFSAPQKPTWLNFNAGNGVLSGTPSVSHLGQHSVTLTVSDGQSSVDQSFSITVSQAGNDLPQITSTPDTTIIEGQLYSYTMTASDLDGDNLNLSATTLPGWLSFNEGSGVLSGTATSANIGNHPVVLSVSDGTESVQQSFDIIVFAAPASTNLVQNHSFESGGASPANWTLGNAAVGTTENAQSGSSALKISNNSSPTKQTIALEVNTDYVLTVWILATGVTGGNLVFDTEDKFDSVSQTPGGTAQFLANGSSASVWTKFEGAFNSSSETSVTLRIFGTGSMLGTAYVDNIVLSKAGGDNIAPVFTSTAGNSVDQDSIYTYMMTAADPDGDLLSFTAPVKPLWLNLVGSTLSGTPGAADIGDHNVTVSVSDGTDSVDQNFTITVVAVDPYIQWKINNGIPLPCLDSDCNGNDIPDLLEFALDSTQPQLDKNGSSLDFKLRRNEASITYTIQKSTDLVNWNDHETVNDSHGLVGTDATVPVSVSEMNSGKLFLRLKVEN